MTFARIVLGLLFCVGFSRTALAVTQREIFQSEAGSLWDSPISSLTPDGRRAIIGCGEYRLSRKASGGVCIVAPGAAGGQIEVVDVESGQGRKMRLREDLTDDNAFAFVATDSRLFVVDGNQGLKSERPYSRGQYSNPYRGWITALDLETGARTPFAKLAPDTTCTSLWITKQGLLCHQMRYAYHRAPESAWVLFDLQSGLPVSEQRIGDCGQASAFGGQKWGDVILGTSENLGGEWLQSCGSYLYSLRDGKMARWAFAGTLAGLAQVVTLPGGCSVLASDPGIKQEMVVICDGQVVKHLEFDADQSKFRVLDALDGETLIALRTEPSSGSGRPRLTRLVSLNWKSGQVVEFFADSVSESSALWDHAQHRLYGAIISDHVLALDPISGTREQWTIPAGFRLATETFDLPLTMGLPVVSPVDQFPALWEGGASRQLWILDQSISNNYYKPSCTEDERQCLFSGLDTRAKRVRYWFLGR